jgi:hypothetical protein
VLAAEADAACICVSGINGLASLDDAERLRFLVTLFQIYRSAEQLHYYSVEGINVRPFATALSTLARDDP